jgi:hypothetical protein
LAFAEVEILLKKNKNISGEKNGISRYVGMLKKLIGRHWSALSRTGLANPACCLFCQ